jgi:predicted transcriptional regulator
VFHYFSLLCNDGGMERTTRQFTISLPPDMAEQVVAVAKAESRTISELFREAFRAYRVRRVRELLGKAQEEGRRSAHRGHTPEDVERLVHETRAEERARK